MRVLILTMLLGPLTVPVLQAQEDEHLVWAVLEAEAEVRGLNVRLGDIATVNGTDPQLAARAAALIIAASAGEDATGPLFLTRARIREVLQEAPQPGPGVALRGAGSVRIKRPLVTLSASDVQTLALRRLHEILGPESAHTRVAPAGRSRELAAPAGRYSTRFEVVAPGKAPESLAGLVRLEVRALVDGRALPGVPVVLEVHRRALVLAVEEELPSNRPVDPSKLGYRRVDLGHYGGSVFSDPSQVKGMVPKARLRAGEILRRQDLKSLPVVHRNDPVTVVYQAGALTIRLAGVAKRDGAPGERIPVKTGTGEREVTRYALVVDRKTVKIGPGTKGESR